MRPGERHPTRLAELLGVVEDVVDLHDAVGWVFKLVAGDVVAVIGRPADVALAGAVFEGAVDAAGDEEEVGIAVFHPIAIHLRRRRPAPASSRANIDAMTRVEGSGTAVTTRK